MPSADNVGWLESLTPWPEEFGLGRMRELLRALGDPQRAFPAIHVVGSNGKTTTARLAEALLASEGPAVGAYTSPHVVGWPERIRVRGEETDLEAALDRVRAPAEDVGATQFEVLTAAAFAASPRPAFHEEAAAGIPPLPSGVRADFPITASQTYLNSASIHPMSVSAARALEAHMAFRLNGPGDGRVVRVQDGQQRRRVGPLEDDLARDDRRARLRVQPLQPGPLVRAPEFGAFGEFEVVAEVPVEHGPQLTDRFHAFHTVGRHRLQQPVAPAPVHDQ